VGLLALSGCGNPAVTPAQPPTAQEILAKPERASVKDAHFTLAAHIVTGGIAFDATGDGILVVKPQLASHVVMRATISGQPLKFEQILVGGKEYDLSPDNPRWTVKEGSSSSYAGSFKGKDAVYLGEEAVSGGRAWHVKAVNDDGNPFEIWVRKNDGYPLKYRGTTGENTFTTSFDRFNTGQTVTAPPASDIQP
jgi:hypothetical protein